MHATTLSLPRPARRWWIAVAFVLGCQLVGVLGAGLTETGSAPWYQTLEKPSFQPPSWVFGPVWTLLYAMMGIAVWRVWERRHETSTTTALLLFAGQLALNAAWTPIFFGAHEIGIALVVLGTLWVAVFATILEFRRVDVVAAGLLLPYLAWLSFATVLNAAILKLN